MLSSCWQKITCPAYQSQYYLDQKEFKDRLSLFEADSIPKPGLGNVKKTKFGIIDEKPYWQKFREMKDIEMVTRYPEYRDTILMASADSLAADTLQQRISPYHTLFNYDQLVYNTLFGNVNERGATSGAKGMEDTEEPDEEPAEEEKPGFFKRLFSGSLFGGGKNRKTAQEDDANRQESDNASEESIPEPQQNGPSPQDSIPAEEEEEDDGF